MKKLVKLTNNLLPIGCGKRLFRFSIDFLNMYNLNYFSITDTNSLGIFASNKEEIIELFDNNFNYDLALVPIYEVPIIEYNKKVVELNFIYELV